MGDGRVVGAESEKLVTANDMKKKLAADDTHDDDGGMEAKEGAAVVVAATSSSGDRTAKNFENDEVSA
jgi:hypothetical protein